MQINLQFALSLVLTSFLGLNANNYALYKSFLNKEGGPCKARWMVLIEDVFENIVVTDMFFRTF